MVAREHAPLAGRQSVGREPDSQANRGRAGAALPARVSTKRLQPWRALFETAHSRCADFPQISWEKQFPVTPPASVAAIDGRMPAPAGVRARASERVRFGGPPVERATASLTRHARRRAAPALRAAILRRSARLFGVSRGRGRITIEAPVARAALAAIPHGRTSNFALPVLSPPYDARGRSRRPPRSRQDRGAMLCPAPEKGYRTAKYREGLAADLSRSRDQRTLGQLFGSTPVTTRRETAHDTLTH